MLKEEIINLKPDIITMQEVDENIFYSDILKYFNNIGFFGYFSLSNLNKNYGICILYKENKFYSLKTGIIDYDKISKKYLSSKNINKFTDKINRRFSSLVINLKLKSNNKNLFIISVHLDSNIYYEDVKNFQAYIVLKYINKISDNNKVPIILTGDFNALPISSTYKGITTGISHNYFYMEDIKYPEPFIKTPSIFTKNKFISSYQKVFDKEPKYTNYTNDFKGTTDYIFVNSKINVLGALEELNKDNLLKLKSIPNDKYPSDHFIQVADIQIK